jgi:hypothetical protein
LRSGHQEDILLKHILNDIETNKRSQLFTGTNDCMNTRAD